MAQQHVMLDLETFGTSNDARIVSIGAVKFVPEHDFIGEKFYVVINPRSDPAGKMDADTILWWMSKERTVPREKMLAEDMVDIGSALEGLAMWYGDMQVPVWGNGATFDNVILRSAFERVGIECPWSFRKDRCYRTINNLVKDVPYKTLGDYHNALDDAMSQAVHLMKIGKKLGIKFQ